MTSRIRIAGISLILLATLQGQGNLPYPTEEYFGGGIGYTPMFLRFNMAEAFPFNVTGDDQKTTGLLESAGLGFTSEEIAELGDLLVIHGAEGFGNITGHWRIGAYVGLGSKSISRVDSLDRLQDLKVSLMTGNASIEVVAPVFSNLEVSVGSLFGFSRSVIQFAATDVTPDWDAQFMGTDTLNTSVTLSGSYFSFQPYLAVKLQFLNRAGLRMSAGYQVGTLADNKWTLNDFQTILAPSPGNFTALAVRLMLYIGI